MTKTYKKYGEAAKNRKAGEVTIKDLRVYKNIKSYKTPSRLKKEFVVKDKLNWERIIGIVLMIGTFILWAYAVVSYDKAWGLFSKIVWSILCLIFIIDFSTWGKK